MTQKTKNIEKFVLSVEEMCRLARLEFRGPARLHTAILASKIVEIPRPSCYRLWRGDDMRESTLKKFRLFFETRR